MYNLFEDMSNNIQPMIDAYTINHQVWEKLTLLQSDCITSCVSASLNQCKALAESQDSQSAAELQMQYFRDIESNLTDAAEKEIAALSEARDAYTELAGRNFIRITDWTLFKEVNAGFKPPGGKA